MLDVAFAELPRRAAQQVRAQLRRLAVDKRHRILQLVTEAVRATRLVEAAARPQPARERLVREPSVGEHVDCAIAGIDLHRVQRAPPVLPHTLERGPGRGRPALALHQSLCFAYVAADAHPEYQLARLARLEIECHMERRAGIHRGAGAVRQVRPAHCGRRLERSVAADELGAIACPRQRLRSRGLVDVEECDAVIELHVVRIARAECATRGIDLGDHVHQRSRAQLAQHPFDIAGR